MEINKKDLGAKQANAIIEQLRQIISLAENENDAVSRIMVYANENKLKFIGVDFKKTGSIIFKIILGDGKRITKLAGRFSASLSQ
jgi:hypothetical protein